MGNQPVRTIFSGDRTRQVVIFRRSDGTFGFEELRFSEEEAEWISHGRYSVSFTHSEEAALAEARSRVRWLTERD
jgi:hypothetical protein